MYKDLAFSIVRYRLPHGLPKTYWYCSTGEVHYFSSLHCTAGVQCHHLHLNVSFKLIFKILYETFLYPGQKLKKNTFCKSYVLQTLSLRKALKLFFFKQTKLFYFLLFSPLVKILFDQATTAAWRPTPWERQRSLFILQVIYHINSY